MISFQINLCKIFDLIHLIKRSPLIDFTYKYFYSLYLPTVHDDVEFDSTLLQKTYFGISFNF